MMIRFACAAVLVASAAFAEDKPAAPPAAASETAPKPPEELKAEKWFLGDWNCKGQRHGGLLGPEGKTSMRLEMKMDIAGYWMEVEGKPTTGPLKGQEVVEGFTTWDGTQHDRYEFVPGGVIHLTSKGWDGDKVVFDGDVTSMGKKSPMRHTITRKGDNAFDSVMEQDGKPLLEESCTRAGKKK